MSDCFDHGLDAMESQATCELFGIQNNQNNTEGGYSPPAEEVIYYDKVASYSTDLALCIIRNTHQTWIPRSQIKSHDENAKRVVIPRWLFSNLKWKRYAGK